MRPKDRERAKLVILELVRAAGGQLKNKTNLFKAFWKAHLEYAQANHGYLTGWPIVRMPQGPGIHDFDPLIGELLQDGYIHVEPVESGGYQAFLFRTTPGAEEASKGIFGGPEFEAIKAGVEFVANRTASAVSNASHTQSRSWQMARDGEELNIYLDIIPADEYEADAAEMEKMGDAARRLWSA